MNHKHKATRDLFDKYASEYSEKFKDQSHYASSFDLFCDQLPKDSPRVLELGCGPGNVTHYLLRSRPDLQILGVDLAPGMIEMAKEIHPSMEFEVGSVMELSYKRDTFSGVLAAFLFPYLNQQECSELLGKIYDILQPEGVVYISTMEGNHNASDWLMSSSQKEEEQLFIHYYNMELLRPILHSKGFEIMWSEAIDSPTPTGVSKKDLLLIAKKKAL